MNKEATKLQKDMNEVNNQSKADLDVSGVELAKLDKVVTELDKEVANATRMLNFCNCSWMTLKE